MFDTKFGIEIEFTGITREQAANVAADYLDGTLWHVGGTYDAYTVTAPDGRTWTFASDGSLNTQRRERGQIVRASKAYSVELISPVLTYREDIETLQGLVRRLRKAGGFTIIPG